MKSTLSRSFVVFLVLIAVLGGCEKGVAEEAVREPLIRSPLDQIEAKFGPPVMLVKKPEAPPAIDGKLDDAAWRNVQPVELGFLVGGWDQPSQKTEARLLADGDAFYFAVRCFESNPEQMVSAGERRDGAIWAGDTVEFFLDPGHKEERYDYYHVIVNPKGLIYDGRGKDAKAWDADISAASGRFEGGWTVEVAVPMKDMGLAPDAIPRVWGLNINRQRPELGVVKPKGSTLNPGLWKLDEPGKYRDGEDAAWSPTYCHSSHIAQRFGHALLEAGSVEVAPPERLCEVIYKFDFDDGKPGPFRGAVIVDDNFRGAGKCIAPAKQDEPVHFAAPLEDLDDVTLIMTLKMPQDGRLYYFGRAPDDEQCRADRHEIFMTREQADAREFPTFDMYHTHADMIAWKPMGRLWKAPGPWVMMTGHFSEPSIGSVMQPGTDWVILRTRLGMFKRQRSQAFVPLSQDYPNGLIIHAGQPFLIDAFVVFRGMDMEPPVRVEHVSLSRDGNDVVVSWSRAKDNTLAAYYQVMVDGEAAAETHQLSLRMEANKVTSREVTVVAFDLYGNASRPSLPGRF